MNGYKDLFELVKSLSEVGETRVLLTSREALPEDFGAREMGLPALGMVEGKEVLSRVLRKRGKEPARSDETDAAIDGLVAEVGRHARSLVVLGELIAEQGIEAVTRDVRAAMAELEARYPDQRERSLIASVRLSLARLPKGMREKVKELSVFRGAAHSWVISQVLQIEMKEVMDLARKLVAVGLADADKSFLLLDPGLGAAVAGELTGEEREAAEGRWLEATMGLVKFLYKQRWQDAHVASHGARVALTDLLAGLARIEGKVAAGRVEAAKAVEYARCLEALVSSLGMPRVLTRLGKARRKFAEHLPVWSHERFNAESQEVERKLEAGDLPGALKGATDVRDKAEAAGDAYPQAPYDRALAWWHFGRVLEMTGHGDEALPVLDEAQKRFAKLAAAGGRDAARMESAAGTEKGDVLLTLGRLDEAAVAYETSVQKDEALGDQRGVAVGRGQLGAVRLLQRRFQDALKAYDDARKTFEALREPGVVAGIWHQIGIVHAEAGTGEAAEQAYKQSLALSASLGDRVGEAKTLGQLGILYKQQGRFEDAVVLYRQSADAFRALGNPLDEGRTLNNLGIALHQLRRLDEARDALESALAAKQLYGHTALTWTTWMELEAVERDAGQLAAADKARREALRTYRAYRADGGEPMNPVDRLIAAFGQTLRTSGPDAARALLPDASKVPAWLTPVLRALGVLAAGSRDPALTEDPALHIFQAVELALVLESLAPRPAP